VTRSAVVEAEFDVAVVGGGAAGLATAIFARRRSPRLRVVVLEGARTPGAKILVSGGSRCNVTNVVVTDADFCGSHRPLIRRVLRAFSVPATVDFFREIGVSLREEAHGKLFPETGRSRDVLDALLGEAARTGADVRAGQRVLDVAREGSMFRVATSAGSHLARAVVLATGGLSLPKTGSDGWGYRVAKGFGHSIVPTTPALVPLVLGAEGPRAVHRDLSGVAHEVRLDVRVDGAIAAQVRGALLWTHFGVSGPAVLDASRHWLRARLEGRSVEISASLRPAGQFDSLDREWVALARTRPRATVRQAFGETLPASVASSLAASLGVAPTAGIGSLARDDRRALVHALLAWRLDVRDSRGYSYAEVTAGGVPLNEVDTASMESRVCPGLHLVGEILDVDGRIGGFNFQWAWGTARVAGHALAARLTNE
jgi:predicted Rossmann fold flavoprotein